jgi:hypothetical protein
MTETRGQASAGFVLEIDIIVTKALPRNLLLNKIYILQYNYNCNLISIYLRGRVKFPIGGN